ncbi:MAG: hypothetical protein E7513_07155 [Ruminococcaceae bacterium]|nr:hypothetical protein [Oscillospiraceae bacterium]
MEDKNIPNTVVEENEKSNSIFSNKKKLTILIIVAVLLVALIVIVVSFITPKSITGAWELIENPEVIQATDDQIEESDRVYYIFEKSDKFGKGEWATYYDGGVEYYEYELSQDDGTDKVNLGSVDLEYKFSGSKLLGNAQLTLIYPEYTDESTGETVEAQEYVLTQAREPKYSKESFDDYETDDLLIGEWATNERTLSYFYYTLSYVETVEFNDNGVMTIHYESEDLALDRYMYYAYTAKDSKLTFSLVTDKETEYTVAYEFDDNGNLKFINDTTQNSIFADQFFGDVIFYTPDNLPEPTEATAEEPTVESE